jgi:excisionase family DNA binding protein
MITILIGTNSSIRIPAKAEKPGRKQLGGVERIGYSTQEAATALGVSEPTILLLIKEKKIRIVKIGHRTIVSVQSLRDFIDGKKEPCGSVESSVESQG